MDTTMEARLDLRLEGRTEATTDPRMDGRMDARMMQPKSDKRSFELGITPVGGRKEVRTLEQFFQGYGVRIATLAKMTEMGFTVSTLMNLTETELEDLFQTISDSPQMDLLIEERLGIESVLRAQKRYLKDELEKRHLKEEHDLRQRLELRECEIIEDSPSEGERGKLGVRKGGLLRRGRALGRQGALAGENPGGEKEGKKERESSEVAAGEVTSSFPTHKRRTRTRIQKFREEPRQGQLLPGIPDDVTLDFITPKLSWTDLFVLPSISHVWKDAVYSRQVYRARVQAHATQHFHVTCCSLRCVGPDLCACGRWLCLRCGAALAIRASTEVVLDPKSGVFFYPRWTQIPKIPNKRGGFHSTSGFFYFDGKMYAVGRLTKRSVVARIFSFDLGGKKQWIECASRDLPNHEDSVSFDLLRSGKVDIGEESGEYEIYNPELNVSSSTTPRPHLPQLTIRSKCGRHYCNSYSWLEWHRGFKIEF